MHKQSEPPSEKLAGAILRSDSGVLGVIEALGVEEFGIDAYRRVLSTLPRWRTLILRKGHAVPALDRGLVHNVIGAGHSLSTSDLELRKPPSTSLAEIDVSWVATGVFVYFAARPEGSVKIVEGISRGYGRTSILFRLGVALALLEIRASLGVIPTLEDRRLWRIVAYLLCPGSLQAVDLARLLAQANGPDPWVDLTIETTERSPATISPPPLGPYASVVGGRVSRIRHHASISFVDLVYEGETSQLACQAGRCMEVLRASISKGDWLLVAGTVRGTRTGEALFVQEILDHRPSLIPYAVLEKQVVPTAVALLQSYVTRICRQHLEHSGFREILTPVLTPSYFGGRSRPFETTFRADGSTRFLRVTCELALKSVLVSGIPRCYEIGPVFRNEGMDRSHLPEFQMLEAYGAYMSVEEMFSVVAALSKEVLGLASGANYRTTVTRTTAREAIMRQTGIDIEPDGGLDQLAVALGSAAPSDEAAAATLVYKALEAFVVPKSDGILAIGGLPAGISPLIGRGGDGYLDRIWVAVNGVAVADVAREEIDFRVVADSLRTQFSYERLPIRRDYRAFLRLLASGMPPCTGVGLGLSRLFQAVSGNPDIRSTQFDQWWDLK